MYHIKTYRNNPEIFYQNLFNYVYVFRKTNFIKIQFNLHQKYFEECAIYQLKNRYSAKWPSHVYTRAHGNKFITKENYQ